MGNRCFHRRMISSLLVFSRRMFSRATFLALILSAFAGAYGEDYFPPPDSQGGWRTLTTPAEIRAKAGMDSGWLDAAYNVTERSTGNGGLLVVRHGYLVFEKYFGRASRNANPDMASTGK